MLSSFSTPGRGALHFHVPFFSRHQPLLPNLTALEQYIARLVQTGFIVVPLPPPLIPIMCDSDIDSCEPIIRSFDIDDVESDCYTDGYPESDDGYPELEDAPYLEGSCCYPESNIVVHKYVNEYSGIESPRGVDVKVNDDPVNLHTVHLRTGYSTYSVYYNESFESPYGRLEVQRYHLSRALQQSTHPSIVAYHEFHTALLGDFGPSDYTGGTDWHESVRDLAFGYPDHFVRNCTMAEFDSLLASIGSSEWEPEKGCRYSSLNFRDQRMGDKKFIRLLDAMKDGKWRPFYLNVDNNDLTDEGLLHLKEMLLSCGAFGPLYFHVPMLPVACSDRHDVQSWTRFANYASEDTFECITTWYFQAQFLEMKVYKPIYCKDCFEIDVGLQYENACIEQAKHDSIVTTRLLLNGFSCLQNVPLSVFPTFFIGLAGTSTTKRPHRQFEFIRLKANMFCSLLDQTYPIRLCWPHLPVPAACKVHARRN